MEIVSGFRINHFIPVLAMTVVLSACGGSGGGDNTTSSIGGNGSGNSQTDDTPVNEAFRNIGLYINEVMPEVRLKKSYAMQDSDGTSQPWLEIYNTTDATIDLSGFSLATTGDGRQSWPFPSMQIQPREFLRIWGSGKDRSDYIGELHTSFSLMGMKSVSLVHKDGSILDRVENINIPPDQAWGRYPDGKSWSWFYNNPTPGAPNPEGDNRFSLNCDDLSLTAGKPFQLETTPSFQVSWNSSNALVSVDQNGSLFAATEAKGRQNKATITARGATGNSRSCDVTVVGWAANISKLTVVGTPDASFLIGFNDDRIYHTTPNKIYASTDGLKTSTLIGSFPPTPSPPVMRKTPFGYFATSGNDIYSSRDLNNWTLERSMLNKTLEHGFAHHHDAKTNTSYLYAGEYSTVDTDTLSVHRGITQGAQTAWDEVLRFDPPQYFYNDRTKLNTIRHVHLVVTDPYTGHVWVGTGDWDQHSRLYYSDDNGASFKLIGIGSQKFRSLSVWFTENYVYWNMDSEVVPEHVYRLPRSKFREKGQWPSLTPELSSGSTRNGVKYMVIVTSGGNFPVGVGEIYVENRSRNLNAGERVRAIEDPYYDYSEDVANLTHASHWYHLWVKDQNGDDVLIMNTSAEGTEPYQRDEKSRTFGFKEHADGTVDVQELLAMPSLTPDVHNPYTQLIPNLQDADGYVYFRGRETAHRIYKMRLNWVDQ